MHLLGSAPSGGRALGFGVGPNEDPQSGDLFGAEWRGLVDDALDVKPVAFAGLVAPLCRLCGLLFGVHAASGALKVLSAST
jgi:hypothetical protein